MRTIRLMLIIYIIVLFLSSSSVNAQFSDPQTLFITQLADLKDWQILDYNNDGVDDIVAHTGTYGGKYTHFIKNSEEGFILDKSIQIGDLVGGMKFYDIDLDGDLDLYSNGMIYENDNLNFTMKLELSGVNFGDILFYDMDDDGLNDLVPGLWFLDENILEYPYFKNYGNWNFELVGNVPNLDNPATIHIGDFNKDGKNEIMCKLSQSIQFFTLNGGSNVEYFEIYDNYTLMASEIVIGDIDGDGWEEIITHDESDITVFFYENEEFTPKKYHLDFFMDGMLLYDYDHDGIKNLMIYDDNYHFLKYDGEELTIDTILEGPKIPWLYKKSKIIEINGESILLRARSDGLDQFDIENDDLINGTSILDDFTFQRPVQTLTYNNKDLGYAFYKGSTLKVLNIDPISHEPVISTVQLKDKVRSMILVELETGHPVYVVSYINDPGIYIFNANSPSIDNMGVPKFNLNNSSYIYAHQVANEISILIADGTDLWNMTYTSDYEVNFMRPLSSLPRQIFEVDLNHDNMKDILWISEFTMWVSENTSNGYGDFKQLKIDDEFFYLGSPLLFDYDKDGEIEIIHSRGQIKILDLDSNFEIEETSIDIEGALFINHTGNVGENTISLSRYNGLMSIHQDFENYLSTGESDIELNMDKHLAGATFFRDLDSDGDLDIVIKNRFSLSVSLFGDSPPTIEKSNNLIVYPNPTNGNFHFESDKELEVQAIYNATGNLLQGKTDLLGQPSGVYYIEVKIENKIQVVSIAKE